MDNKGIIIQNIGDKDIEVIIYNPESSFFPVLYQIDGGIPSLAKTPNDLPIGKSLKILIIRATIELVEAFDLGLKLGGSGSRN